QRPAAVLPRRRERLIIGGGEPHELAGGNGCRPGVSVAQHVAQFQAAAAADHHAVAARGRAGAARQQRRAAVADQELGRGGHGVAGCSRPRNSYMWRSYSVWPCSVLKSSRSSLMTLML